MDVTIEVEALIPKRLTINFTNYSICDSDVDNPSCIKLNQVLGRIDKEFIEHKPTKINIFLAENYLTDKSLKQLLNFIQSNPKLAKRLIKLDLTSNRLTDQSITDLQTIIDLCPRLKLLNIKSNLILIKTIKASVLINYKQLIYS